MGEAAIERTFPARVEALRAIRGLVRAQAAFARLGETLTGDLVLVASEACSNAARHAGASFIRIGIRLREDCVELRIEDDGVFDRRASAVDAGGSGRGVPIMLALMDEVTVQEGKAAAPGTVVMMRKCFDEGRGDARQATERQEREAV